MLTGNNIVSGDTNIYSNIDENNSIPTIQKPILSRSKSKTTQWITSLARAFHLVYTTQNQNQIQTQAQVGNSKHVPQMVERDFIGLRDYYR